MAAKPSREPRYPCLTQLSTRGTFYDVGYNVGLNFSQRIQLFFAESDNIQHKLLPFYHTRVGRDYHEECLRVTEECFPQYVREVRGMADGSGVPFEHLFQLCIHEKIHPDSLASQHNAQSTEGDFRPASAEKERVRDEFGCTTVYLNRPDLKLLLHNEDCDPLIKPYGYLLTAHIEEDGVKEEFTSFCYPGCLPGRAMNFNKQGVVVTTNALYPDHTVRRAPSRVFLSRALLSARNLEDAVRILKNEPYGAAYGFCANICTSDGDMAAIEVGPNKPRADVHVHRVEEESDPDKPCHYYHFNSYKHLKDALVAMGDTADTVCPVFRTPRPTDRGETVATGMFDVTAREMLVYQGNPAAAPNKPILKVPMYC
nr:hypothetical protein BaRGS_020424 [Batillaria attramentaria]